MGSLHLIRHGQASFGAADYDQLSELGYEQASSLGVSWEASGWAPTSAIAGGMKRHAQTAISAIDASGAGDGYDVDAGWDEYDHLALARAHDSTAMGADSKAFQRTLNLAITGWMAGEEGPGETYADFRSRVMASFDAVVSQATSGGRSPCSRPGGPSRWWPRTCSRVTTRCSSASTTSSSTPASRRSSWEAPARGCWRSTRRGTCRATW
jgi:broad specificity phosphatase PhoE